VSLFRRDAGAAAELAKDILADFGDHEAVRRPWEPAWDKVTDLIYPRRSSWSLRSNEQKILVGEKIFDGTAIAALNLMSDGTQGKLVTSSMPFFKLRFKNRKLEDEEGAKDWLEKVELVLYGIFSESTFYDAMAEIFPDAIAIGTAYLFIELDPDEGIVFSPRHFKEMYISENRVGRVDTFYRHFCMSLRQAAETFGEDMPKSYEKDLQDHPEQLIEVLHCVKPRKGWKPDPDGKLKIATAKRFASYYMIYGLDASDKKRTGTIVREGGYDLFPLIAWRFRKNPGEVYGRGPGLDSLYDVEMLNVSAKTLQEAGHRALKPPLVAHQDFNGHIRQNPGGITYWDGEGDPRIKPLDSGGNFPFGLEVIQEQRKIVREHFHADFFTILNMQRDQLQNSGPNGPKTATEIDAITAETASVMGTIVSRNQSELLSPVITLVFNLAREMNALPEIPDALKAYSSADLEPEFIGPLAMAQRRFLTYQSSYEAAMSVITLANAAQKPELLFNFDWDGISRDVGDSKGLSAKNVLDPKAAKKLQEQWAQAQQKMLELKMQLEQQKNYPGLTKAPEPGSAVAGGQRA
jgi:hypothetical protein